MYFNRFTYSYKVVEIVGLIFLVIKQMNNSDNSNRMCESMNSWIIIIMSSVILSLLFVIQSIPSSSIMHACVYCVAL